jgi:hypothetical protein
MNALIPTAKKLTINTLTPLPSILTLIPRAKTVFICGENSSHFLVHLKKSFAKIFLNKKIK